MDVRSDLARAAALLGRCRKELLATGATEPAAHLQHAMRRIRKAQDALPPIDEEPAEPSPEPAEPEADEPAPPASRRKAARNGRRERGRKRRID